MSVIYFPFNPAHLIWIVPLVVIVISTINTYAVKKKKLKFARINAEIILAASIKLEAEIASGTREQLTARDIEKMTGICVLDGKKEVNNLIMVSIIDNKLMDIWSTLKLHTVHWSRQSGWENISHNNFKLTG